jgi:hypothetical protein
MRAHWRALSCIRNILARCEVWEQARVLKHKSNPPPMWWNMDIRRPVIADFPAQRDPASL